MIRKVIKCFAGDRLTSTDPPDPSLCSVADSMCEVPTQSSTAKIVLIVQSHGQSLHKMYSQLAKVR